MLHQIRPALTALFVVVLTGCMSASPQKAELETGLAVKTVENNFQDPLFQPLNNVDLSQYERVEYGLLFIAHKKNFDLFLTEPGKPYKVSKFYFSGIKTFKTDQFMKFSGYMVRWKKTVRRLCPISAA